MLTSLRLKNFQIHRDYSIEFDDEVTVVVGRSDCGKSSLVRAIRWALTNKPFGASFVTNGEDSCEVEAVIDGHKVVRSKGKDNLYELDGNEYRAFASSVPDTIQSVLNVDDLNFQCQHDAPFWLSLSAGEVSKRLNAVVDLGVIDTSLFNIKSKVAEYKSRLGAVEDLKREKEEALSELDWVEEANSELASVEDAAEVCSESEANHTELHLMVRSIESYSSDISEMEVYHKALKSVGKPLHEYLQFSKEVDSLSIIVADIEALESMAGTVPPDIDRVDRAFGRYTNSDSDCSDLKNLIGLIIVGLEEVKELEDTLDVLLVSLAGFDTCPLCGSELREETISHIHV